MAGVTLEPLEKEFAATLAPIDARLNSPLPKVQLPGDDRLLSAFAADSQKF